MNPSMNPSIDPDCALVIRPAFYSSEDSLRRGGPLSLDDRMVELLPRAARYDHSTEVQSPSNPMIGQVGQFLPVAGAAG